MKKYISRTKTRLSMILMCAFLAFELMGYISSREALMIIALFFFIAGFSLMLSSNRCPYCGDYFKGLYWSKPNAGYCRKCGKLIEFDDCDGKD